MVATTRASPSKRQFMRLYLAERDGWCCNPNKGGCGKPVEETPLDVAHLNGIRTDDRPENLALMCRSCNNKQRWAMLRGRMQLQGPRRPPVLELVEEMVQRHQRATDKEQAPLSNFLEGDMNQMTVPDGESERERKALELRQSLKIEAAPINRRVTETGKAVSVSETSAESGVRVERMLGVEDEPPEMRVAREKKPEFTAELMRRIIERDPVVDPVTTHEAEYGVSFRVDVSSVVARRWLNQLLSRDGPLETGQGKRGHQVLRLKETVL